MRFVTPISAALKLATSGSATPAGGWATPRKSKTIFAGFLH